MAQGKSILRVVNETKFIEVKDGLAIHYLAMTIGGSYKYEKFESEKEWEHGELDLRVQYLFGPHKRRIGDEIIHMGASISTDSVKLSNGEIMLNAPELRGRGITSYALNQVVMWAKLNTRPEMGVARLRLGPADAVDEVNKSRRNEMYKKFGFKFVFSDQNESIGYAYVDQLSDVKSIDPSEWKQISVDSRFKGFEQLAKEFNLTRERYLLDKSRAKLFLKKWGCIEGIIKTLGSYIRRLVNTPLLIAGILVGVLVGTYLNESSCLYMHRFFSSIFPWL